MASRMEKSSSLYFLANSCQVAYNISKTWKALNEGENPLASENELKHPYAIMEFISVFTQDRSYVESVGYLENISRMGGAVTMCAVADALKTEGRREGKVELLVEMDFTVAEISEKLKISEEEVEEIIQRIRANL